MEEINFEGGSPKNVFPIYDDWLMTKKIVELQWVPGIHPNP
jgi:hypothetical protein